MATLESRPPMSDAPLILNPDTPLAFLDPTSAYQTSVSLYITVASLGVSISWINLEKVLIFALSPLTDISLGYIGQSTQ